jgi:hypothetical protein
MADRPVQGLRPRRRALAISACGSNTSSGSAGHGNSNGDGDGNSSGSGNVDPGSIAASQIILSKQAATANAAVVGIQARQLPENVEVLASQVVVDTSANNLQSSNLQAALNTEIAVDLNKNILGEWDVRNFGGSPVFTGSLESGKVDFRSDGTFIVTAGGVAIASACAPGAFIPFEVWICDQTRGRYRVVDGIVQLNVTQRAGWPMNGTNTVVLKNTANTVTLLSLGGYGAIAQLTRRVTSSKTSSPPPPPATTTTMTKAIVRTALKD